MSMTEFFSGYADEQNCKEFFKQKHESSGLCCNRDSNGFVKMSVVTSLCTNAVSYEAQKMVQNQLRLLLTTGVVTKG